MYVDLSLLAGTEVLIGFGCSATMLILSAAQRAAAARVAPRRAQATDMLAQWLAGAPHSLSTVEQTVAVLPRSEQSRILMALGSKLEGEALQQLQTLGSGLNLTALAQRSLFSRRWWSRLRAARYFSSLRLVPEGLTALLHDPNFLVRAEAVTIACASRQPEHVARAAQQLFDPPSLARFACQVNLPRAGPVAGRALAELLQAPPGDPLLALRVAGALRDPGMTQGALACSQHASAPTRAAAAELLGQLGGTEALARLQELLAGDPTPEVRAAAALALAALNHWEVAAPLAALLSDPSWQVRYAAATALKKLGPPGELFLRRISNQSDEPAKTMALFALQAPGLR